MRKNHIAFQHNGAGTEDHIFVLTFHERLNLLITILFHKTLRITLVSENEWKEYCMKIADDESWE